MNEKLAIFIYRDNHPTVTLGIVMHKSNHVIKVKDYEQAAKLAELLYNETKEL